MADSRLSLILLICAFAAATSTASTAAAASASELNHDKQTLLRLKYYWGDPPSLAAWGNSTSASPCSWNGVRCSLGAVTAVVLRDQGLDGVIPTFTCDLKKLAALDLFRNSIRGSFPRAALSRCRNLVHLDLSRNSLTGPLPPDLDRILSPSIQYLGLAGNRFSGALPAALTRFHAIRVLLLDNNNFSGSIPREMFEGAVDGTLSNMENLSLSCNSFSPATLPAGLGKLKKLRNLEMSEAGLTGEIPVSIGELVHLETLDLARNQLTGPIPEEIGSLPLLTHLDLSENNLSGTIPGDLADVRFTFLNLSSNALHGQIPKPLGTHSYNGSFRSNAGLCLGSGSSPGGGASLFQIPRCVTTKFTKKTAGSARVMPSEAVTIMVAAGVMMALLGLVSAFFTIRCLLQQTYSYDPDNLNLLIPSFRFSDTNSVGGSKKVSRFRVEHREEVAVKKIQIASTNRNLWNRFVTEEAKILHSLKHPNIARLFGCLSEEQDKYTKLVVYEYTRNGNLHDWLHGDRLLRGADETGGAVPLDWAKRLEIAIGAAQGLVYMHHSRSYPVVHRNVKSSNILLDADFKAKVADFGFAKMLEGGCPDPNSGYVAPEWKDMKEANEKTDIHGFGVVLLELVTGKQPNDAGDGVSLVQWAWLQEDRLLQGVGCSKQGEMLNVVDEQIKDERHIQQMTAVFKLGLDCTSCLPSRRPTMNDVLQELHRIAAASADATGIGLNMPLLPPTAPPPAPEDRNRNWDVLLRVFILCCGVVLFNPVVDNAHQLVWGIPIGAAVAAQLLCFLGSVLGVSSILGAVFLADQGAQPKVPNWVARSAQWLLMLFVVTAFTFKISAIMP